MKSLMVVLGLVVAMSVVSGCAGMRVPVDPNEAYGSLVGSNIDRVVNGFGYATETTTAPNGNKVYVYDLRSPHQNATRSGLFNENVTYTNYSCKLSFEIDSANKIVRMFWNGNVCRCERNEENGARYYYFWNTASQLWLKYSAKI